LLTMLQRCKSLYSPHRITFTGLSYLPYN